MTTARVFVIAASWDAFLGAYVDQVLGYLVGSQLAAFPPAVNGG